MWSATRRRMVRALAGGATAWSAGAGLGLRDVAATPPVRDASPSLGDARPALNRAGAPAIGRYALAFGDDFDDADLSRINEHATGGRPGAPAWRSRYRQPRKDVINREKQIYMDPGFAGTAGEPLGVQPFRLGDGRLSIRAERADPVRVSPWIWGYRHTSGCITSERTHWQTYGYFEMRARLPVGRGLWPAFWLLPKREAWPPEIDIFEASGDRPNQLHLAAFERQPAPPGAASGWIDVPAADADGFATYALEWDARRIAWFVQGRQVFERRDHGIHEPMYLLANLALGSHDPSWIPDPDATTPLPADLTIDYIRAYRRD